MTIRKCIYTGKDSDAKDRLLPDNPFNWTNTAPTTKEYKEKKGEFPTELEMQANEIFHLLELARNRVLFYEAKLAEIQKELKKYDIGTEKEEKIQEKPQKNTQKTSRKDMEIKKAIEEKEILEESEKAIEEVLKKKTSLWD